jgi:beta-1,4-mannosyl-glycoprotein beta-1,4-N-acetylglucosaminyltransferase
MNLILIKTPPSRKHIRGWIRRNSSLLSLLALTVIILTFLSYYSRSSTHLREARPPRIIEAFVFNMELDILETRLATSYPHVDAFVLVESRKAHSGFPKPLYFQENIDRFRPYLAKIHHFVYDSWRLQAWKRERAQRNYIRTALQKLHLQDDDLIFISDVDEIIDYAALQEFLKTWDRQGVRYLALDMYYYDDTCFKGSGWTKAYVATYKTLQPWLVDLTHIRRAAHDGLPQSGWHLTYYGDIRTKLKSTAHTEFNHLADDPKLPDMIASCWDIIDSQQLEKRDRAANPYPPPKLVVQAQKGSVEQESFT